MAARFEYVNINQNLSSRNINGKDQYWLETGVSERDKCNEPERVSNNNAPDCRLLLVQFRDHSSQRRDSRREKDVLFLKFDTYWKFGFLAGF